MLSINYYFHRIQEIFWQYLLKIMPKYFSRKLLYFISNFNGNHAVAIRYACSKRLFLTCNRGLWIRKYVVINNPEKIITGSSVSINEFCYISAAGGLSIGNNVLIGNGCSIMTTNHIYDKVVPVKDCGLTYKPVIIKDNVWIGAKAVVLPGVIIEKNSVVAAGAVVTKNVPENSIVAGVPAVVIKNITRK